MPNLKIYKRRKPTNQGNNDVYKSIILNCATRINKIRAKKQQIIIHYFIISIRANVNAM